MRSKRIEPDRLQSQVAKRVFFLVPLFLVQDPHLQAWLACFFFLSRIFVIARSRRLDLIIWISGIFQKGYVLNKILVHFSTFSKIVSLSEIDSQEEVMIFFPRLLVKLRGSQYCTLADRMSVWFSFFLRADRAWSCDLGFGRSLVDFLFLEVWNQTFLSM